MLANGGSLVKRRARNRYATTTVDLKQLGTHQELWMSWIVPQLERLERALPSVDLHLYFRTGPNLLLRVPTMEIDCAVTSSRYTDPKLDASPDLRRARKTRRGYHSAGQIGYGSTVK
jgi:hypothetical protein